MNFILTLINTINKNFLLRSALFPFFTVFIWFSKIYNGLTLLLIKVDFFSIWVHVKLMFLFSNWTKHQVFWTTLLLNIDVGYYTVNQTSGTFISLIKVLCYSHVVISPCNLLLFCFNGRDFISLFFLVMVLFKIHFATLCLCFSFGLLCLELA